jgi:hypothetical protein
MTSRFFRAFAVLATLGTIFSTGPSIAANSSQVMPTASHRRPLSVVELDLAGVSADAIPSLPSPDLVPLNEGAVPPSATATAPIADATAALSTQAISTSSTGDVVIQQASLTIAGASNHRPRTPHPGVLTTKLDTKPFTVLGVTWDLSGGLSDVVIRYRVRESGTWTRWSGVSASDAAPDPGTPDAKAGSRAGTDPIVALGADGLQIWAEASKGTLSGIKAVLIDPGADTTDINAANASFQATATTPSQPPIISRAGWGANESLRTCSPDYSNSVVSAAVHHTASTNTYAAGDVSGIIRGIYSYHTRAASAGGRGWCDIGYNFLVDRFGRVFEGRAGGVTSTVVGAHTGGFNSGTIGVSAIGDYAAAAAPPALVESISQLIAWKFSVHHILAGTSVRMVSGGGESKFPAGTVVTFPTIYGHRDAGLTTCPGQHLYDMLPAIRSRVANLANASVAVSPIGRVDAYTGESSRVSVHGWAFDPESTASITIRASVDGAIHTLTANTSRPDVGRVYGKGDNHGFSGAFPAGSGQHVVCVTAVNIGQGSSTVLGCQWVRTLNASPIGVLDKVSTTPTSITVAGWALDPDTTDPIAVHAYLDGHITGITANQSRPDVGRIFGKGDNHGYNATMTTSQGPHRLCLYLINTPTGSNPLLTCRNITTGNLPIGVLDKVSTTPTSITVAGWALDPDTTDPIAVHAYLDGHITGITANQSRPDVGRIFGKGDNHGYNATMTTSQGPHRLCLYLINTPTGSNPLLTCRNITTS